MHFFPNSHTRGRHLAGLMVVVAAVAAIVGTTPTYAATGSSYLSTLNSERAAHGLTPLHSRAVLDSVAHAWAARLAATGWLRHNPALERQVHNWQSLGENVGDGPTVGSIAHAFWASAPHRANILDPSYSQVGIAGVRGEGRLWMVVVFRGPLHQTSVARQTARGSRSAARTTLRSWPGHLLMVGSIGRSVAYVQRLLGVRPDGVFGPQTKQAVVSFQRRHQLGVDGIVGPITWGVLVRTRT